MLIEKAHAGGLGRMKILVAWQFSTFGLTLGVGIDTSQQTLSSPSPRRMKKDA
jgi:hypothetical protein